jgi:hypothetical protein
MLTFMKDMAQVETLHTPEPYIKLQSLYMAYRESFEMLA